MFAKLRSMSDELPILTRVYEIYKSLDSINDKLPKPKRYGLGTSTEQTVLALLEQLLMAKHAPKSHKAAYLLRAQAQLETLRFKLRLYLELQLVNETRIMQTQARLQEIGRMLGGWLKSLT
jgi:hypothetical protein